MSPDRNASPLNPLPPAVWLLLAVVVGVEAALQAGLHGLAGGPEAVGWRLRLVERIGFSGALWEWMVESRRFAPENLMRFLTYPAVHAGPLHAAFIAVLLAALGKTVGEVLSGWRLLALVLAASASGAFVYGSLKADPVWLIGGYPAVFGLVGAFTFLLWTELAAQGANKLRAFALLGVLLVIRVAVGLWMGISADWIADVVACAVGFALAAVLAPGGWARLLERLRAR